MTDLPRVTALAFLVEQHLLTPEEAETALGVAEHVAFYKPSEMPGIIAGDIHARYEEAYKRGEKASFLRYNSVVFVTEKPA